MMYIIGYQPRQRGQIATVCLMFLLSLGFLLACFVNPAQAVKANMAIAQKKQEAITFLQAGQLPQAYDAFMLLLREAPDDDDINLGIAVSAYGTGKYAQALIAYERLLAKYPRDSRLRMRVAQVHVALNEPESARLELEKAKGADPNFTDDQLEEVLSSLTSQHSRWQFQGRVSAGVIYDSNSNQGTNTNFITLGGFEDLFVAGAQEQGSWGTYLSTFLEAGYRLGDKSPFWLMSDLVAYQRWNTSSGVTNNRSISYGRTGLGLRYLEGKVMVDARMKADQAIQRHKELEEQKIFSFGPDLTFVVAVHPKVQLITRGGLEKREYSVSDYRDGTYWNASQYVRFFLGQDNHELMLGVTGFGGNPEVKEYKSLAVEPSLRLVFKLPNEVSLSPFVTYKEENYEGPATALEVEDRRDTQWRVGATVAWDVTDVVTLDLNYQHVNNDSNSELYQYSQDVIKSGITFNF